MAILDFLWGGRRKRALAKQLLASVEGPFGRLHAAIDEAGHARMGDAFDETRTRFVDCRILRSEELSAFPADDREALFTLVSDLLPKIGPIHAEVREALDRVHRGWRHGGLVEAAAGGGLRALDLLHTRDRPKTPQDRLFRIALFMDVDTACRDIEGELRHVAEAPSLFW